MAECADAKNPPPVDRANVWLNRTEAFLATRLGNSYVIRFNDATGTPSMVLTGVDPAHQNVWFAIYYRVVRLEQFSQQLPP
jgi:hypothetical protein